MKPAWLKVAGNRRQNNFNRVKSIIHERWLPGMGAIFFRIFKPDSVGSPVSV